MVREIHRLVKGLRLSINLILGRGIVRAVDDTLPRQRLQVSLLNDEIRDNVERFQNYGFTSVPQIGAETVVIFSGGDRSNGVVIVSDDKRYRVKGLEKGEVCLYTDEGDSITMKRGNLMALKTKTFSVECGKAALKAKSVAIDCDKAAIKNSAGEIVGIVSDLIQALLTATAGGDPLVCPALPALKAKIDSFKVMP